LEKEKKVDKLRNSRDSQLISTQCAIENAVGANGCLPSPKLKLFALIRIGVFQEINYPIVVRASCPLFVVKGSEMLPLHIINSKHFFIWNTLASKRKALFYDSQSPIPNIKTLPIRQGSNITNNEILLIQFVACTGCCWETLPGIGSIFIPGSNGATSI